MSDLSLRNITHFNPRSLAGATINQLSIRILNQFQSTLPRGSDKIPVIILMAFSISIHAPSRERLQISLVIDYVLIFQSTLPRGSDISDLSVSSPLLISIHAPSRERLHQNKLLLYSFKSSIFCELAQLKYSKIYFDVRKLIVSHSSLSCEPKLNFMFHITSHHEPKLHKR